MRTLNEIKSDARWLGENMTKKNSLPAPVHPELVYRVTGEWKGWTDFLGDNLENRRQDEEDEKRLKSKEMPDEYKKICDPKSKDFDELGRDALMKLRPDWFQIGSKFVQEYLKDEREIESKYIQELRKEGLSEKDATVAAKVYMRMRTQKSAD